MLRTINLSLSSICGADCIYCPSDRGKSIPQKVMSFEVVKTVIDEISSSEFREKHRIRQIEVGENGDAFLNKDILRILRYIKSKLPHVKVVLYTNFQYIIEEKAKIILEEGLIDHFCCNIDGYNAKNYFTVKRIDLANTEKNIRNFIILRRKLKNKSTLAIFVLTLCDYIKTIQSHFGLYPGKLKDQEFKNIPDDFLIIKKHWKNLLTNRGDRILRSFVAGWAERERVITKDLRYQKYRCPYLSRVKEEAFIAPDGTWYACCLDSANVLRFGNVMENSIASIYSSPKRAEFIALLEKRGFAEIDGPCKTVNSCQLIYRDGILRAMLRKVEHFKRTVLHIYNLN